MTDDDAEVSRHASLADRLNHLFATVVPAGRKPYTTREVAKIITEQGTDISSSYVHALRSGDKINPTVRQVQALANFFGVPVGYFFNDDTSTDVDEQLATLMQMRDLKAALDDAGVRVLALKARGLSPNAIKYIEQIVDHVRELEQGRNPNTDNQ